MFAWVLCALVGILFVILPYSIEWFCKWKKKKVPYFFRIPKPVRYIAISFVVFVILINTQIRLDVGVE